ncbi:MAG: hypothetical protein VYE73_03520 [Acidobacteriota bacterium]|nr:hypothetical protein [Acidobacteriota bacterium]
MKHDMIKTAAVVALTFLVACQSSSPPPEEDTADLPVRVENAQLKLALVDVPDVFDVESNSGAELRLVRTGEEIEGSLWIEVSDETESGINMVDLVNGQRDLYQARLGGSFSGSRELMMADGRPGYYSRGRFLDGELEVEEFRIFSIHPLENRLLTIFYRYPAGADSADRLNDVLLVAGEVEGFDPEKAASGAGGGP